MQTKLTVLLTGDRFNLTLKSLIEGIGAYTDEDNKTIPTFI